MQIKLLTEGDRETETCVSLHFIHYQVHTHAFLIEDFTQGWRSGSNG